MKALNRAVFCLCCFAVLAMGWILPQSAKAASNMQVSDSMVNVLKTMEGFSKKPYWDYAQWTVGYGTKCPEDKREYYSAYGITEAEALKLLQQELDGFEANVNRFADTYSLKLKQNQFDALVSFTYNCGPGWMSENTGYFNTAVRSGSTDNAFIYGICLFSAAGEDYILAERRLCEAYMYIDGGYKASNDASVSLPDRYKYVYLEGNGGKVRYAVCGYDANAGAPVNVSFSKIPTGVDSKGKPFAYELEGWYTDSGRKVEKLDASLQNGQVLYARWRDPSGNIVRMPIGETVDNLTVTLTGDGVNVRSGPGTYFPKINYLYKGTELKVTEVKKTSYYTWGNTQYGWVSLDYTNYKEVAGSTGTFPKTGSVTGTYVNYRTAPSLSNSQIVGQKGLGDRVTITQETYADGLPWGKMTDGNWICLDYVRYDADVTPGITGIKLLKPPTKTQYRWMKEPLELEGSVLQVSYSDGSISALTVTREMVTDYKKASDSAGVVEISYGGKITGFAVELEVYQVVFKNWDGSVLTSKEYAYGERPDILPVPERPADNTYAYTFAGWDKPVEICTADAVYTAVFTPQYIAYTVTFVNMDGRLISSNTYRYGDPVNVPKTPERPEHLSNAFVFQGWGPGFKDVCYGNVTYTAIFAEEVLRGDMNCDGLVNDKDVGYLLWHTKTPDRYPLYQKGDVNGDGLVDDGDVLYLLRYTLFPDKFTLHFNA